MSAQKQAPPLAEDILWGAAAIAEFCFGDPRKRRQVYHMAENHQLPTFLIGSTICARKSTIISGIEALERQATEAAQVAPATN
jgi:hypothetical protein